MKGKKKKEMERDIARNTKENLSILEIRRFKMKVQNKNIRIEVHLKQQRGNNNKK